MLTIVPPNKGNVSAAHSGRRMESIVGGEKDLGSRLHEVDVLFSL